MLHFGKLHLYRPAQTAGLGKGADIVFGCKDGRAFSVVITGSTILKYFDSSFPL